MRHLTLLLPSYLLISQARLVLSLRLLADQSVVVLMNSPSKAIDALVSFDSMDHEECQARIASRLQLQCGGSNQGEETMSEKERRSIAISFTLCSMISASQPIPTECVYWAPGAETGEWSADMERYLSPCIAALRRSTQDWTSYEGYLNKASQLCLALEGRMQAEVARQAYIELTSHSIQVFKDLQDHLEKGKMDSEVAQGSVRKVIDDLQQAMIDTFSTVSILVSHGERQDEAIAQFEEAVNRFSEQGSEIWKSNMQEGQELLRGMMSRAEEVYAESRKAMSAEMSVALAGVVQKHAGNMEDQLQTTSDFVGKLIQNAQDASNAVSLADSAHLESVNLAWADFVHQVHSMGSEVNGLTDSVSDLIPAVSDSLNDAARLKSLHSDLSYSVSNVQNMSNRLYEELSSSLNAVNQTLSSLSSWRHNLGARSWWRPQGITLFAGPSLLSVGQLQHLNDSKLLGPALRVTLTLVAFLANLLISTFWLTVSAMTFLWIVTAKRFRRILDWSRLVHLFEPTLCDEEEIIDRRSATMPQNRSRTSTRSPPSYTSLLKDELSNDCGEKLPYNSTTAKMPPTPARSRLYPQLPRLLEPIEELDEVDQRQQRLVQRYGKLRRGVWIDVDRQRRAVSAPL